MDNTERKITLQESRLYIWMQHTSRILDHYGLDGFIGLVPGGIGDVFTLGMVSVQLYFSMVRLRSWTLTLALLNNALYDTLLGLIPFFVGNIIDFFYQSNRKNMVLIDGFINNEQTIVRAVHRKALQSIFFIILMLLAIIGLLWLLSIIAGHLGSWLFS